MATAKTGTTSLSPTDEKDLVLDSLYWIKQILSIIIGLTVGSLHLSGVSIILGFGILVSVASLFYTWQVAKASDIEPWDIVTEAFGPSFFCFVLAWTLTFTFIKPNSF